VLGEHRFDLGGVDVLAAADEHVFLAALDAVVAVRVHAREVARSDPPRPKRGLGLLGIREVAGGRVGRTKVKLADRPLLDGLAVLDHAGVHVHRWLPHGVGLLAGPALRHREVVRTTLGESVPLREVDTAVPPGIHDRLSAGTATGLDDAQGGEVGTGPVVVVGQHPQHCGDGHED
jgi:hypothetical protein